MVKLKLFNLFKKLSMMNMSKLARWISCILKCDDFFKQDQTANLSWTKNVMTGDHQRSRVKGQLTKVAVHWHFVGALHVGENSRL